MGPDLQGLIFEEEGQSFTLPGHREGSVQSALRQLLQRSPGTGPLGQAEGLAMSGSQQVSGARGRSHLVPWDHSMPSIV